MADRKRGRSGDTADTPEWSAEQIKAFQDLFQALSTKGGVPITLSSARLKRIDTAAALNDKPRVTVAFPPCSDELLALFKTSDTDEVTQHFREYFKFYRHIILADQMVGSGDVLLDPDLLNCLNPPIVEASGNSVVSTNGGWPTDCCLCPPCVTLDGNRNGLTPLEGETPAPVVPSLKRLFVGDLVWMFFFERMGIFQILGAILDSYACNGRLPISNGSLGRDFRDDITALVLEVMVRQTKMGMSSTVRDRACTEMTSLGWISDTGRKLSLNTQFNTSFNTLFHKLIYHSLEFYRDKRLAVAIQGTATAQARPSAATLVTISDTIDVLKKRFESFSYGRNYYNTLSGIVWVLAGMSVVRELRTTLGIPPAFESPDEYIPAAYDLLIAKRPVTQGESNRYLLHRECARQGRDILLDLEVIIHTDKDIGGELDRWLEQVEGKIEGYRTAFRALTGVDLGVTANPVIEQQA
jgi:hypothetical protein